MPASGGATEQDRECRVWIYWCQTVTGTVDGVETVEVTLIGAPLTGPKLFVRVEAE